jgi:hypothetical protein
MSDKHKIKTNGKISRQDTFFVHSGKKNQREMVDVRVSAALDKRTASRKKGGGKGRKGGHVYMFNAILKVPFADALETVPQIVQVPPSGVRDKEHVSAVQNALQRCILKQFKPLHESRQAIKSKEKETEWSAFRCSPLLCLWYLQARRDPQLHCDVIPSHIVEEAGERGGCGGGG